MPSHRELGTQRWKDQRIRVLQRDNYTCVYCNAEATQVDHVIPRTRGGTHDMDNLVACCSPCNSRKGSRSHASFLALQSTPPVFSDLLSTKTSVMTQQGPCTGQPEQDNN